MATGVRFEDSFSNPYFLHPNESPSTVFVSTLSNGNNYHSWCPSMKVALISKNKMKFVDGSITAPTETDPLFQSWERWNTMLVSCLINSVTPPSIAQSVLWLKTASEIWRNLYRRFAQKDSLKI